MKFNDIINQWDTLRDSIHALQNDIHTVLNTHGYSTKHEESELKFMDRACNEMLLHMLGYFD